MSPKWPDLVYGKTLENPNFEEISVFEGYDGSKVPKMYSGEVSNIFENF